MTTPTPLSRMRQLVDSYRNMPATKLLEELETGGQRYLAGLLAEEQRLLRKIIASAKHGGIEPGGVEQLAYLGREVIRVLEYDYDLPPEWAETVRPRR